MKLVDVNVAMYAYHAQFPNHALASEWFREALSGAEPVGFTSSVVTAFVRLSTSSRIVSRPLEPKRAVAVVDSWFDVPGARVVEPGRRYWPILRALVVDARVRGNLVSDAHLAAVAIEHGAELVTFDRDFARFPDVRVRYLG